MSAPHINAEENADNGWMTLRQEIRALKKANIDLQHEAAGIKEQLLFLRMPSDRLKIANLEHRLHILGQKMQINNSRISDLKEEKHLCLTEAFMETTIRMFDPQDISEIWDRVYVDYPHLKSSR